MTRQLPLAAATLLLLAACYCLAQAPAPAPAPAPATQPASTSRPACEPAALKILQTLEQAGNANPAVRAKVTYTVVDPILENEETRTGYVAYRKGAGEQSDRFRIHFADRRMDKDPPVVDKVDYAFDGNWLAVIRHAIRNVDRYQVAPKGKKISLQLRGPFPLPFGQPVDDVLRHFEAVTVPLPAAKGPDGAQFIRLTVRPEARKDLRFRTLEMWVDPKLALPVRIVATDDKKKVTTVSFRDIESPQKIADDVFAPPAPTYRTTIKPLESGADLRP